MGLLDDAIREHLELKRLRGADPGIVAREEKAALGPVSREGQAERQLQDVDEPGASPEDMRPFSADPVPSADTERMTGGQETIEINMEDELAGGADTDREPKQETTPSENATPEPRAAHTQTAAEESLEWEVPGDSKESPRGAAPDALDEPVEGEPKADEHVEDVLEETPDFLRDTPEQERLWFEQRPPRDFDFNE
jgi:hypothetical protein